jgi:hypothetical protein
MGAPFKFKCGCGKSLAADASMAGKRAKCPNCGQVVEIPKPPQPKSADDDLEMLPLEDSPLKPKPAAPSPARRQSPVPQAANPNRPPPLPPGRAAAPAAAANSIWDEVEQDDYRLQAAAVATASPCPKCGTSMSSQAVLCIACGYNKQTGVTATTQLAPLPSKSGGKKSGGFSLFKRKRGDSSPKEQSWRLPIGLLVGGIALLIWGFKEKSLSDASSQVPETISLQQLIARGADGNPNIVLTNYRLCDNYVYEGPGSGSTVIGSWTKIFVPIVPPDGDPFTKNPQALIHSTRVKKVEDFAMLQTTQLRGMVTNRITSLDSKERNLLLQVYPNINFDRCIIFQEGREPKGSDTILLILLGGGGLTVAGGLLALKNFV